jgi:hypothetical protein
VSQLNRRYVGKQVGNELQVQLNEMQKGKSQPVIFGLSVPAHAAGELNVATVILEFEDVSAPGVVNTTQNDAVVHLVADPALIRSNINRDVLRQWEELDAVQAVADIVDNVEAGKMDATAAVAEIDKRGMTLVKRGSAQASDVIEIGKTIARSGGVTAEIKKSTVAYKARLQQGQS